MQQRHSEKTEKTVHGLGQKRVNYRNALGAVECEARHPMQGEYCDLEPEQIPEPEPGPETFAPGHNQERDKTEPGKESQR
jgi:hypothetical protein